MAYQCYAGLEYTLQVPSCAWIAVVVLMAIHWDNKEGLLLMTRRGCIGLGSVVLCAYVAAMVVAGKAVVYAAGLIF